METIISNVVIMSITFGCLLAIIHFFKSSPIDEIIELNEEIIDKIERQQDSIEELFEEQRKLKQSNMDLRRQLKYLKSEYRNSTK